MLQKGQDNPAKKNRATLQKEQDSTAKETTTRGTVKGVPAVQPLSRPDMGNIPVCYGKSRRTVQGISRCNTTSTKLWYGKYQTVVRRIPSCGMASSKQRNLPGTCISLDKQAGIERNNPLSQA